MREAEQEWRKGDSAILSSTVGKVTPEVKLKDRHEEKVAILGRVDSRDKGNVANKHLASFRNNLETSVPEVKGGMGKVVGDRIREVMGMEGMKEQLV